MSKKVKIESRPDIPDTQILTESNILEPAQEEVTESLSEDKPHEEEIPAKEETPDKPNDYQYVLISMVLAMLCPPIGIIMSIIGFKKENVIKDNLLIIFHILTIAIGILSSLLIYYMFIR